MTRKEVLETLSDYEEIKKAVSKIYKDLYESRWGKNPISVEDFGVENDIVYVTYWGNGDSGSSDTFPLNYLWEDYKSLEMSRVAAEKLERMEREEARKKEDRKRRAAQELELYHSLRKKFEKNVK